MTLLMNNTNPMMMMTPTPTMMMMKAQKSLSVVKAGGDKSSQFTRLMMMKTAAAPHPTGNTEHHVRIRDNNLTVAAAAKATATTTTTTTIVDPGLGDPCLDLYFGIKPDMPRSQKYSLLKKLLPAAWSHNPLTTLKLICNLLEEYSSELLEEARESFFKAAVWLHHNHPKTLAANIHSIFCDPKDAVGDPSDLTEILYLLRKSGTRVWKSEDYRLLHDRASDLLANNLRENIQDMNKKKPLTHWDWDCIFPEVGFPLIALDESVAKKLFPRESYPEYQGLEESLYTDAVRDRLQAEVLMPLLKDGQFPSSEKDLKAARPRSLLPHKIIEYANCEDNSYTSVAQAQLDWERMVEDVYLKQRKFKNCLVVCNTKDRKDRGILLDDKGWSIFHDNVVLSLAILVSQLSGGPWKGKVINSGSNPELHNMPSNVDLVSKCAFLRRMMDGSHGVDIPKVFDLVLQAAVNANLRPDQMVKRVFLVTISLDFDDLTSSRSWDSDYEAIVAKYKEKGYDQDAVPQIVLWRICNCGTKEVPRSRPGVATLAGFSNNLFKSFLDNDGQLGPHHVMEVAISGPMYQDLIVVD